MSHKEPEQLDLPIAKMEERRPNKAVIHCRERDDYVEEFVNWYVMKSLPTEVMVEVDASKITVNLMLDDEILDTLYCPQAKDVPNGTTTL